MKEFSFTDTAPWPIGTDGTGKSLVLISPESNPDPDVPANWRASARVGGSPGRSDDFGFPGDPVGDADGNGEKDLIDYALGNDLGLPPIQAAIVASTPGNLRLIYPISLGAVGVRIEIFFSTDFIKWENGAPYFDEVSRQSLGDGRALINWNIKSPLRDESRVFLRLKVTQQ